MKYTKIALIPAYKPGNELPETVRQLYDSGFQVVVVTDGSGDCFKPVFDKIAGLATIGSHIINRGKGEALKTGMVYIKKHFGEPFVVVTADADGQHKTSDIIRVCEAAEAAPDSLILGSRGFDRDVPLRSRFGNTVTRTVYRISSGVKVYDTQTGLRAFSNRLLDVMLDIPGSRYEYEMNMLMEMPRRGITITEVPIETVYLDGNSSSHFDTVRDSFRIYREILRYSASSLLSFIVDYSLFCLISVLTGSAVISNITARLFSSTFNFTLNRRFVFRSEQSLRTSAVRYFTLAAAVLTLNTLILRALTLTGLSAYASKLITEVVLFIFSYVIQHRFVFRKERVSA